LANLGAIIAPFWADVDTRLPATLTTGVVSSLSPTQPHGNSTGTDLVWSHFDSVNGVMTITWDDVGYYNSHPAPGYDNLGHGNSATINPSQDPDLQPYSNAFQLQLVLRGNGDFDIIFRYEDIHWLYGDASGGSYPIVGYTAGDGVHYANIVGTGSTAMANLENLTNTAPIDPGVFIFQVRGGQVVDNNDVIDGGAGHDTLTGGIGTDTFVFRTPADGADTITDFQHGTDELAVSAAGFGGGLVGGALPSVVSATSLASASFAGSGGDFVFVDAASGGTVYWDATGGSGSDAVAVATLTGVHALFAQDIQVMSDILTGHPGSDTFVFTSPAATPDLIETFEPGTDHLQIAASAFGHGLTAGGSATVVDATSVGAASGGTSGYFIFDTVAHNLYWDATGGSGSDATLLAHLNNVTNLTSSDFHLV
jgi:hypothetical protein